MKRVIYNCDAEGCKYQTEDKKTLITYIYFTMESDKKGRAKAKKHEKHYCGEDCLRKDRGFKEIKVQK